MKAISIKGVLIGGIVDVVTSAVLGIPFALYAMFKVGFADLPKDTVGPAVATFVHENIPLYIGQLMVGLCCSVLGGYVAARLAKHDELLNGALSAFLCVSLGIYAITGGKGFTSLFMQIVLLVVSPLLGLLGGYLGRTQNRTAPTIA